LTHDVQNLNNVVPLLPALVPPPLLASSLSDPSETELTAKITKLHKEGKKAAKGKKDNGSNLF
jgi:hypothetical protein